MSIEWTLCVPLPPNGVGVTEVGEPELVVADPGSPFFIVFTPVHIAGEPVCREHIAFDWGRPSELAYLRQGLVTGDTVGYESPGTSCSASALLPVCRAPVATTAGITRRR